MNTTSPIRVLVVDDSKSSRQLLAHIIESDPTIKIVGFAEDGEKALDWLKANDADVITMDLFMPKINGFEVSRKIMETKPIPIVIVSSAYNPQDTEQGFKALEAGALAFIGKPAGMGDPNYSHRAKEIVDTIKIIAEVKLIKRRTTKRIASAPPSEHAVTEHRIEAVAIGASLGGPIALQTILSSLPKNFPVPIFIVQHIAHGFTQGFVNWLQTYSTLHIVMGENNMRASPGICYVAPDGFDFQIKERNIISLSPTCSTFLCPSVGSLFASMATTYGPRCVGVLLTGMGRDGALELLAMKNRGAYTIAQDEESCLMFGMPQEAIKLGAARMVLPLNDIAATLNNLVQRNLLH